jgi:diaminohydroxyphosphoribosylaminopyrimidine deaminase/5-amino-6-(5-phosphoribosylamino)uracil reductase
MNQYTFEEQSFMREALDLAKLAYGISDPNPRVGCLIVKNNQIIGKGFTQAAGSHHAEVMALQDAASQGHNPEGGTAFVTLEPCCHFGKTPPCTQAFIAAKLARVIIAAKDPNPLVFGKGIQELQAQGIDVQTGLFEQEAMMHNLGFMKRMRNGLPWVRLKIAASLDGVTALPNGQSQWITSELARADGHRWRAQSNILLTGIGTILADNPQLNVRGVHVTNQPVRAIIDSRLDIPLDANILHNGSAVIFCAEIDSAKSTEKMALLNDMNIPVVQMPNPMGKVDLPAVLRYLAAEYSANEVHIEAGYKLNGSLIREHCVDELLFYLAPQLLGTGAGLANVGPLNALSEGYSWKFIDQERIGDDLRLRLIRHS